MEQREKRPYMKDRCQIYNRALRRWVKYEASTGTVMQIKRDAEPFARVRKRRMG